MLPAGGQKLLQEASRFDVSRWYRAGPQEAGVIITRRGELERKERDILQNASRSSNSYYAQRRMRHYLQSYELGVWGAPESAPPRRRPEAAPESFQISCLAMVPSCPPEAGIVMRRGDLESKEREMLQKASRSMNSYYAQRRMRHYL